MSCSFTRARGWLVVGLWLAGNPAAFGVDDEKIAFFEKEIRPTLIEACQSCHGPKKQHGGLRLDSREALLAGSDSGPVVVSGKPDKSLLITALRHKSDIKMPPKAPLPEPKIAAFVRWVELGVPWPAATTSTKPLPSAKDHWAFQPVKDVAAPKVQNETWVRTPIDRFVLARLEAEGLTPSPQADRRTLIRRATFDVTGLPPTPEEVEAFVRDDSPNAYAKQIDRLLASPHYGEQWGRHWLDVARYSDTKGYVYAREERFWVHAWAYRDWVIRSLNADMPYNRFVGLQLASDQLAPNDPPSQAAMGYLTLGRRFLGVSQDIIDDRIDVTTRGLMGLTVTCARCHDHKYDPIPTADYYALSGVFRSSEERLVPITAIGAGESAMAGTAATESLGVGLQAKRKKLDDTIALRRNEAADRVRSRLGDYLRAQLDLSNYPEEGFDQILSSTDLIPGSVRRWRDRIARPGDPVFAAWNAYARLPKDGFATAALVTGNRFVVAMFTTPPRDMADVVNRYTNLFRQIAAKWQAIKFVSPGGLLDPAEEELRLVLEGPDSPCELPGVSIVDLENYVPSNIVNELWKLQVDIDRYIIGRSNLSHAIVLADRASPTDARIYRRGNSATPTDYVPRQFLKALSPDDRQPFRQGSGRLELANAITDPANPLTARVMVNRVWMHHFGSGLVRTPSDFGVRSDPPSHPELLDWLAKRFVADGWSLKALHRQILLSATYQQSPTGPTDAAIRDRAMARDPANRWLWRATARRLSFEEIRDSLFAVTGDLDRRPGGRAAELTTRPFTPRRAVYGLTDRQFLPDLFRTFDVANPDLHTPQRSETTVPQQALFFLNHPLLLDRAAALTRHSTVVAAASPEEKVTRMYRLAYQREPTPAQVRAAVGLVRAIQEDAKPQVAKPTAWSYGVAAFDPKTSKITAFRALPHFNGSAWQGGPAWPDAKFGWAQLTATGGHPGNDLTHSVVRRWTAPADVTVRIESSLLHEETAGDGIRGTILSSRTGLLKTVNVHNSATDVSVPKIELKAGDTLDFIVDIRAVLNSDQYSWAPIVADVKPGGMVWSAKTEFGGPGAAPQLGEWEQLAQALLMANEFSFVD